MMIINNLELSNELRKFESLINYSELIENPEVTFSEISLVLMNKICIVIGENKYKITECEFYYKDAHHNDVYIHGDILQQTSGRLFLNYVGGLDITFGNKELNTFGGILLRGIKNIQTDEYINGVTKITSEVFKSFGSIFNNNNRIFFSEFMSEQIDDKQLIYSTKRIGLVRKQDDKENFIDKPYRYIGEIVKKHKFKDKEKVLRQLLFEKKITIKQVTDVLGYSIKEL